jgi:hypothetical protein
LGKYHGEYTDELLIKRWDITKEEWGYIDSRIKSIDSMSNGSNGRDLDYSEGEEDGSEDQ